MAKKKVVSSFLSETKMDAKSFEKKAQEKEQKEPQASEKNPIETAKNREEVVLKDGQKQAVSNIITRKKKPEPRSRRTNLLFRDSVYNKAQEKCNEIGISFNDCMNQLLEHWVDSQVSSKK